MLHAPSSQDAGVQVVIIRAALGLSLSSSSEEPGTGVSPSLAAQGLSQGAAAGALFAASCAVLACGLKDLLLFQADKLRPVKPAQCSLKWLPSC